MERDIIQAWSLTRKIALDRETEDKMLQFAELIYETNRRFNITGLKTTEEILSELILKSIDPLCDIIVPRGTRFVDIGSGAGIPGIILALYHKNFSGVLIEANNKKAEFIKAAINELNLSGLEIVCDRAEIIARDSAYRERFDWCFARAFGKLYIAVELGAPFVKGKGFLYIYSNIVPEDLPEKLLKHAEKIGLRIMSHKEYESISISGAGLCFKKESKTPDKYPRRFAIIKREAEEI